MSVKSVLVSQTTYPLHYPTVTQQPLSKLQPNDVAIRLLYAPINPADINMIEGRYIVKPDLPFTPGNEAVGIITDCGAHIDRKTINKHVIFPFQQQHNWQGFWREKMHYPFTDCIIVPHHIDPKQASMLSINALTALVMLTQYGSLQPNDWVIQNLANSCLGRWVIYIAKQLNLQTINIVRRPELIDELQQIGATAVILDSPSFSANITQKGLCKLALNGVGGHSAKEVAKCLTTNGTLVTYGAMAKEPITISNSLFIFKNIIATGFNRTTWVHTVSKQTVQQLYQQLFKWLKHTPFEVPIDDIYQLNDITAAIKKAQQPGLNGKVLLSLT